ncbi:hypothetical protein L1987_28734 [Smallanthus sonchifolius]|uniref:Uncharacterized protein n=1 Tax=Smallanthus sonchifolius TaxID=185202 RepID=A0ACB9HY14_9ASTR|nr:hypothetical protein L1987_28734 [Smallanthus sonchifolius]
MPSLKTLRLNHNSLHGNIPEEFGNRSCLQYFYVNNNQLTGFVPPKFFNQSCLRRIELSVNGLSGSLPEDMCNDQLGELRLLFISDNEFTGPIPSSIIRCQQLRYLSMSYNKFNGTVPRGIGNMTLLKELYLGENELQGSIPSEIGNLKRLEILSIFSGNLEGHVPQVIFNMSSLKWIDFHKNSLSGVLFPKVYTSVIPDEINHLHHLEELNLQVNSIGGNIRFNISALKTLNLVSNLFSGELPADIGFWLPNLQELYLGDNTFRGTLPSSIINSSKLSLIELSTNSFSGSMPITIGRLELLERLLFGENYFTVEGSELNFLSSLTNCRKLRTLAFAYNPMKAFLPASIGNLSSSLLTFEAFGCGIKGIIPSGIGNLTNLRNHKSLIVLNLSSDILIGNLPSSIGSSSSPLIGLDLSFNRLSGDIPSSISGYQMLNKLSLAHNNLQGSIPESLGKLISLEFLNLSQNNLSGEIPKSLETLSHLEYLNVSFNRLQGEIPSRGRFSNFTASSFIHNKDLCGAPKLEVLSCRNKQHESRTLSSLKYVLPVIASIIGLAAAVYLLRRHIKHSGTNVEPPSLIEWTRVSYYELVRATESFDESNLIGKGAYGSVFKGKLKDGVYVAVKVFNLLSEGAVKSFNVECEVLRNIRHRNLVRIISSCTNMDFRCLVMEYMSNGSLEQWLYSHNNHLSLVQRLQISIDVASALEYLHYGQTMPIIHCDLKPSNVLLDEDMHARVCDFGIAKIFGEEEFRLRTATLGTIGYMAPEYGMEGIVSPGSDVYSFGILLLETFTRKKPTEEMFCGEVSLRIWVLEATQRSVFEVVDEALINEHLYTKQESLASIFNLAMDCTSESSSMRINMKETVIRLFKIQKNFLSNN